MCPYHLLFLLLLITTIPYHLSEANDESELLLIFTISRHGDRSPIHTFPNDPFANVWTNGFGQLTKLGASQHVNLGSFIRRNYGHLIGDTYHKDEALFHSSGTDRTLMSGNNFLTGLYPDQPHHLSPPIYSIPSDNDHFLKMSSTCPAFKSRYQELMQSSEDARLEKDFKDVMNVFSRVFADIFPLQATASDRFHWAVKICDAVHIWYRNRLSSLPVWLSERVAEQCSTMLDFKQYIRFSQLKLTRLRGGPLAAHIVRLLRIRANLDPRSSRKEPINLTAHVMPSETMSPRTRLIAYFAHDSTMAALMSHLGIFNGLKPPLASCLIIELHRFNGASDEGDDFLVRFRYHNESDTSQVRYTQRLRPSICGSLKSNAGRNLPEAFCSLSNLETGLQGTYAVNVDAECSPNSDHVPESRFISKDCDNSLLLSLIVLQLVFMAYIVLRIWYNKAPMSSILLALCR